MTDIVFDTEFLEDGSTIDLISIGMINRDTGEELYLVNAEAEWERIKRLDDPFLCRNVIPHLPLARPVIYDPTSRTFDFEIDHDHPCVSRRRRIAGEVEAFILGAPRPRLCAWCSAYDMVALNQLWGPMVSKPKGIPWWCWDLSQELDRLGISENELPAQVGDVHDALADARTLLARMQWLEQRGTVA